MSRRGGATRAGRGGTSSAGPPTSQIPAREEAPGAAQAGAPGGALPGTTARGTVPTGETGASPCALLYAAYARLLSFPSRELPAALADGSLEAELRELHERAGLGTPPHLHADAGVELEATYIATFEVGVPEPPVPLYESAYARSGRAARRALLEELVRFYEFFGFELGDTPDEAPDHLTVELEFVAALAQLERLAGERGAPTASFSRARRDMLQRHLLPFLEDVCRAPLPDGLYPRALHALRDAVRSDASRLAATTAAVGSSEPAES